MTRVINRKELIQGNYKSAHYTEESEGKSKSLMGFAEAMYFYYQENEKNKMKGVNNG